jgi:hypothetical protein
MGTTPSTRPSISKPPNSPPTTHLPSKTSCTSSPHDHIALLRPLLSAQLLSASRFCPLLIHIYRPPSAPPAIAARPHSLLSPPPVSKAYSLRLAPSAQTFSDGSRRCLSALRILAPSTRPSYSHATHEHVQPAALRYHAEDGGKRTFRKSVSTDDLAHGHAHAHLPHPHGHLGAVPVWGFCLRLALRQSLQHAAGFPGVIPAEHSTNRHLCWNLRHATDSKCSRGPQRLCYREDTNHTTC